MIKDLAVKIRIHPLFWLVLGTGIFTGRFYEVVILFLIVFIHEMGHGTAAHFFHWSIEKIELLPFGGVAQTNEYGNRPLHEECIVVLAGPAQHVAMWVVAAILYHFSVLDTQQYQMFVLHNTTILVFNLLPIWPLDGGRLFRVLCSFSYPFKEAMAKSLGFSSCLLFAFALWCLLFYPTHLNLWVVITFLVFAHVHEYKQRYYLYIRFLMGRYYNASKPPLKHLPITVDAETKVSDVLGLFRRGVYHTVVVKKDDTTEAVYEESGLLYAFFEERKVAFPVGEL